MLEGSIAYLKQSEIDQVRRAFVIAEKAHEGQFRASGEPYIVHPVAVARILASMHLDCKSIVVAILHDVIEDTTYTKDDIRQEFDDEVADLVDGVTKLTQIKFNTRAEAQAENFRKMLLAMTKDVRTIIIKLADRMHNMQTVQHLTFDRRRRIARETLDIYAPLARRLGMHHFSLELENYGFSVLHPLRYRILADAMKKVQGDHHDILQEIKTSLQKKMENNNISLKTIEAREKHLYSIYRKMMTKHISFSDITDFYAFRIIVETNDDCYRTLGIVHSIYKPLQAKIKDYIAMPKNNGYQSLHSVMFGPYGVPVEIQIRTPKMDDMANQGVAAHWAYKSGSFPSKSQLQAQKWLKSLIDIQQRSGNSLEFIENVKMDLFPDEVYVFTPKGDIMELPAGATAMDFAYMVHTNVGNRCVAARIDRQLAPLSTVLSNGQTLEIITTETAHPTQAWLNVVVTGKAKSAVRHYLKTQRKSESERLGLMLLKRAFMNFGVDFESCREGNLSALSIELGFESFNDLLEDIGLGNRAAPLVFKHYNSLFNNGSLAKPTTESVEPLTISGTEGMVVHCASCCYPVPGDSISGILDSGEGIVIHSDQCCKLGDFKDHDVIPVAWAENVTGEFRVVVQVETVNKRGVLAMLALAISDSKGNIEDIDILKHDKNYSVVNLIIVVTGRKQLAKAIKMLRRVTEVNKVTRLKK
ncbi:MAG: bifunctional (p)ppGpp synthetase/guanosine-3',5'-bis(diphosphate) 3'-pyrophosphohydrolase [Legionellales bacterium]|jgi:GTP diphosphokinase / guanosine-3',5'-bis(diphosphate) 3'-diphosphatase|nr:bifunctional (p)ppGpp synthetase/guanosine-3',5'-bis(diphosphate) 3'-pyrophosphohydrolase [Legionellales bacterium]